MANGKAGAPKGSQNALGNSGGRPLQDRKLAAKVRKLALNEIYDILRGKTVIDEKTGKRIKDGRSQNEYQLYCAIMTKLAGTILPRLTEHTGPEGEQLTITLSNEIAKKNGIKASRTKRVKAGK